MSEVFDIYDAQNKPLGITKSRPDVHRDGNWHRTTHIYVVNGQDQFLVHLRSPHKDNKPNCWDTRFGGHVIAGMSYEETALRELEEEIGLNVSVENLIVGQQQSYENAMNREHIQVYFYRFDGDIKNLTFNDNEVVEVKWMSPEQIIASMNAEPKRWTGTPKGFEPINSFYIANQK